MSLAMRPNELNTEINRLQGAMPSSHIFYEGTQLSYEVLRKAVSAVRCSVPLGTNWKNRIDEDYESRKIGGNGGNSHLSVYLEIWVSKAVEMNLDTFNSGVT